MSGTEFLQAITFPEEDRSRYTAYPYRGGYRWFRSPNVVCLEHYRGRVECRNPNTQTIQQRDVEE